MNKINIKRQDFKIILVIILPAFAEMVLSQLFGMIDIVMLGHTDISSLAIAAVGLTNNPVNLILGVTSAFCIGISAAVAWSSGAGKIDNAKAVARESMTLTAILGIITGAILFFSSGNLVTFMGAKEDTFQYANEYLQIIALGLPFQIVTMSITASMRGIGHTFLPMMYNLFSNFLNVILNYFLIFGIWIFPELGVFGAALATTISKCIAFCLSMFTIFFVKTDIRAKIGENFFIHLDTFKRIALVGLTAACEQLIMQVGFIFFTKAVSTLPTTVFSAHQVALNINGLAWVPSQAYGVAATSLVGQSLGRKDKVKAKAYAQTIHLMSVCTSIVIATMFAIFSKDIASLYSNDESVINAASTALKLIALGLPGIATQMPIAASLRGAGDAKVPLIANFIGVWFFRVFVCNILIRVFNLGLEAAWVTIVLDQICRAIIVYTRFLRGKWLDKKIST